MLELVDLARRLFMEIFTLIPKSFPFLYHLYILLILPYGTYYSSEYNKNKIL